MQHSRKENGELIILFSPQEVSSLVRAIIGSKALINLDASDKILWDLCSVLNPEQSIVCLKVSEASVSQKLRLYQVWNKLDWEMSELREKAKHEKIKRWDKLEAQRVSIAKAIQKEWGLEYPAAYSMGMKLYNAGKKHIVEEVLGITGIEWEVLGITGIEWEVKEKEKNEKE